MEPISSVTQSIHPVYTLTGTSPGETTFYQADFNSTGLQHFREAPQKGSARMRFECHGDAQRTERSLSFSMLGAPMSREEIGAQTSAMAQAQAITLEDVQNSFAAGAPFEFDLFDAVRIDIGEQWYVMRIVGITRQPGLKHEVLYHTAGQGNRSISFGQADGDGSRHSSLLHFIRETDRGAGKVDITKDRCTVRPVTEQEFAVLEAMERLIVLTRHKNVLFSGVDRNGNAVRNKAVSISREDDPSGQRALRLDARVSGLLLRAEDLASGDVLLTEGSEWPQLVMVAGGQR